MSSAERHQAICAQLNDLYQRKNHDYGDSFHKTFIDEGLSAARIRLKDKMNRFVELSQKAKPEIKNESLRDTLLDLANYAIMTVMELDDENVQGGERR